MKIETWPELERQHVELGKCTWSIPRLIQLSKDLPVMELPLDAMNLAAIEYKYLNARGFVMHMNAVMQADLSYPIILDEDGEIMDGRHRIIKALYTGELTIKAVRFNINPKADHERNN